MIPIGDLVRLLKPNEQATLHYAHEHGISQYIEYVPGRFVGVDAERIPRLIIEQTRGRWSTGSIRNANA